MVAERVDIGVGNGGGGLETRDFYVPGSSLGVERVPGDPLNRGLGESVAAWYWRSSRAFDVEDSAARVTARYADGNPIRSGWILGPEYLAGKPGIGGVSVGEGSVVLMGFQPNYRAQTVATWPLLFNALNPAVGRRPRTDAGGR